MIYVLYFYISNPCSMCAVTNMAVLCSSLILCFPGMLLRYSLNGLGIIPTCPYYYYWYIITIVVVVVVVEEEGKVEVEKFQFVTFTCQNASIPECHISDI